MTRETPKTKERLVVLYDVSESMGTPMPDSRRARIDAARDALKALLSVSSRALTEVGLVAFDDEVDVLSMLSSDYDAVYRAAQKMAPGGTTAYGAALAEALAMGADRIVLVSDGEPTDGEVCFDIAKRCARRGVRIDCVGIDEDGFGAEILAKLSAMTNGKYAQAVTPRALLGALLQLETRKRALIEDKRS